MSESKTFESKLVLNLHFSSKQSFTFHEIYFKYVFTYNCFLIFCFIVLEFKKFHGSKASL